MEATQFPVVSNNATTGWKLQGASVDSLFIKEWFSNIKGWAYVMLSRVKNRKGLFLETKIIEDPSNYFLNEKLLIMMEDMNKVACTTIDEDMYLKL